MCGDLNYRPQRCWWSLLAQIMDYDWLKHCSSAKKYYQLFVKNTNVGSDKLFGSWRRTSQSRGNQELCLGLVTTPSKEYLLLKYFVSGVSFGC
jgi:hypothetical protein